MTTLKHTQQWDHHTSHHTSLLVDDRIVASYEFIVTHNFDKIDSFYVDKDYRGKGYGTIMLDLIDATHFKRDVWLLIRKDNEIAKKMYEKIGFVYEEDYEEDEKYEWMVQWIHREEDDIVL